MLGLEGKWVLLCLHRSVGWRRCKQDCRLQRKDQRPGISWWRSQPKKAGERACTLYPQSRPRGGGLSGVNLVAAGSRTRPECFRAKFPYLSVQVLLLTCSPKLFALSGHI